MATMQIPRRWPRQALLAVLTVLLLGFQPIVRSQEGRDLDRLKSDLKGRIQSVAGGWELAAPRPPEADDRDLVRDLKDLLKELRSGGSNAVVTSAARRPFTNAVVPPGWEVYWREDGLPRMVSGTNLSGAGVRAAPAAGALSYERKTVMAIQAHGDLFQLKEPEVEIRLVSEQDDELGQHHVRFQQVHQGLRVLDGELRAHFSIEGYLTSMESTLQGSPALAVTVPIITATMAREAVRAQTPAAQSSTQTEPELVVHVAEGGRARLAWILETRVGLVHAWRVVVDATTGRVLSRQTRTVHEGVTGRGIDARGTDRSLNVWKAGDAYYMADVSKPLFVPGSDAIKGGRGVILITDGQQRRIEQLDENDLSLISSSSPDQWDVREGVSASFGLSEVYDYYLERHRRRSYDDAGGGINGLVRIGGYDNAFWSSSLGLMGFGDARPYVASLDVIGHELTHGVIEKTAALVYERQPGAANEAFADIFGEMVEARTMGHADWKVGSGLNSALRDLKDPSSMSLPSRMSEFARLPNTDASDHGGVHVNSTIISRAFYLLAEGLPGSLGIGPAEKIFYRALALHLLAQSQFVDVRLAAIASADELYGRGSAASRKTAEAFDGVEILASPATAPPSAIPVIAAADSFVSIEPGPFGGYEVWRREDALNDTTFGRQIVTQAKKSRPAIDGGGGYVLYITAANDLAGFETSFPANRRTLGRPGRIHAVAGSPNGRFVALVLRDARTGVPQPQILMIDTERNNAERSFSLAVPLVDGRPVEQVIFADAMTFSSDSTLLVYDSLSSVKFGPGNAVSRWSISALDLVNEKTSVLVPPLPGIDSGNPSFGRAGNRYLLFEAVDWAAGLSYVFVADLFTGDSNPLRSVAFSNGNFTYPCFTGDEKAVIFCAPDGNRFGSGVSIFKMPVTTSRLEAAGDPTMLIQDAYMAINYRRGTYVGTNSSPAVILQPLPARATLGSRIVVTAQAQDSDGTLERVEFYDGSDFVGFATAGSSGTYSVTWVPSNLGERRLTARAVDNLGGITDSEPMIIDVEPGRPKLTVARVSVGTMRISIAEGDGTYQLQKSGDLATWVPVMTITAKPSAATSLAASNADATFFRLVRQ